MSGPLIFAAPAPHQGAQRCDGGRKVPPLLKEVSFGRPTRPKRSCLCDFETCSDLLALCSLLPPWLAPTLASRSPPRAPLLSQSWEISVAGWIGFLSKASAQSGREAHKHERDWCCWCCGERRGSVRGPADPQSTRNSTQGAEMLGVPTTGTGCRVSGSTTGSSRPKDWRSAAPRSRGLGGGGRARST